MAKTIDPGLAARLRDESEQTKEAPFPPGAVPTRPSRLRSKVYSVRLSAEEQARVQRVADAKHLFGRDTVYALLTSGALPSVRLGGRLRRIRRSDLAAYVDSLAASMPSR